MYPYILSATEDEISRMQSIEQVYSHFEGDEPIVGGFGLEAVVSLTEVFLDGEKKEPIRTQYQLSDGSPFYAVDRALCEKLAGASHESLLDASVPWSESEAWKHLEVNRMDLAGFILDIANLCKRAQAGASLFILLNDEIEYRK